MEPLIAGVLIGFVIGAFSACLVKQDHVAILEQHIDHQAGEIAKLQQVTGQIFDQSPAIN